MTGVAGVTEALLGSLQRFRARRLSRAFRGNGGRGGDYSMVKVVESVSLPDGLVTVSETVLAPGELKKGT